MNFRHGWLRFLMRCPSEVRDMARAIVGEMAEPMRRLQQLAWGI